MPIQLINVQGSTPPPPPTHTHTHTPHPECLVSPWPWLPVGHLLNLERSIIILLPSHTLEEDIASVTVEVLPKVELKLVAVLVFLVVNLTCVVDSTCVVTFLVLAVVGVFVVVGNVVVTGGTWSVGFGTVPVTTDKYQQSQIKLYFCLAINVSVCPTVHLSVRLSIYQSCAAPKSMVFELVWFENRCRFWTFWSEIGYVLPPCLN